MEELEYLTVANLQMKGASKACLIAFTNGEQTVASIDLVMKYSLSKGQPIARAELDKLCQEQRLAEVKAKALGIVSRRSRSKEETRTKLKEKGFDADEIDAGIEFLVEFGYLDDHRYAVNFARNFVERKPSGALRVETELRRRGIDPTVAKDAVASVIGEVDNTALAIAAAEKKIRLLGGRKTPEKRKQSLVNYLRGRGFDWDAIRRAVGTVLSETESNEE